MPGNRSIFPLVFLALVVALNTVFAVYVLR